MRCGTNIIGTLLVIMTVGCRSAPVPSRVSAEPQSAGLVRVERPKTRSGQSQLSGVQPAAYQADRFVAPSPPGYGEWSGSEPEVLQAKPPDDSALSLESPFDEFPLPDAGSPDDSEAWPADELLKGDVSEETLSLNDFEVLAVHNSPTIEHGAARVTVAQGQHLQAGLYPNPTIGYQGVNIGSAGTAGRQVGFVQQRFVTGGKLELDQEIACHEIQNQRALLLAAQQRVLTDVRDRFYTALIAQRREQLTRELVQAAEELTESTDTLLESEQVSENTLLQAEIELEQSFILMDNAANATSEAWQRLVTVSGEPGLPRVKLTGDLENAFEQRDLDSLTAQLLESHPLLVAAQARVERAADGITRAQREVIPDVNFLADAGRTNQTTSNTAQARLSIEVPLWDKNQGNILSAQGELAAARAEVRRIALELQQRLAVVYRRYENALHQVERYRSNILPKAKRSLELVRNGYDSGQVEYLTLLTSQQRYVEVNLAYTNSLEELQKSAALLDGRLLSESLAAD